MKSKITTKNIVIAAVIIILTVTDILLFVQDKKLSESLKNNSNNSICIQYPHTYWAKDFLKYFKTHDMEKAANNLKDGMDEVSVSYIEQFMKNSKFFGKCINTNSDYNSQNVWNNYDKEIIYYFATQKAPEIFYKYNFDDYIYKSLYGMRDLPLEVLTRINGRDIIDLGSYPGDTVYTFHKYFPNSNIYAFEPIEQGKEKIDNMVRDITETENDNTTALIHTIQKGIGDHNYVVEKMKYDNNISYNVPIVTIDEEYPKIGMNNLGLIKIDIEGAESDAIKGAAITIKKYKPVLVIAIYHTPEDFFEMKDKLKAINPEYKFMIRRSEAILADADLVLIAY